MSSVNSSATTKHSKPIRVGYTPCGECQHSGIRSEVVNRESIVSFANERLLMTQVDNLLVAIDLIRSGKVESGGVGYQKYLDGVTTTAMGVLGNCRKSRGRLVNEI